MNSKKMTGHLFKSLLYSNCNIQYPTRNSQYPRGGNRLSLPREKSPGLALSLIHKSQSTLSSRNLKPSQPLEDSQRIQSARAFLAESPPLAGGKLQVLELPRRDPATPESHKSDGRAKRTPRSIRTQLQGTVVCPVAQEPEASRPQGAGIPPVVRNRHPVPRLPFLCIKDRACPGDR